MNIYREFQEGFYDGIILNDGLMTPVLNLKNRAEVRYNSGHL